MSRNNAVVLLSGGLDSATTLYYAKSKGYNCRCLIFDYGQRHGREIQSAREIARRAGCKWQLIKISLPWKGSSLLDGTMRIPKSTNVILRPEGPKDLKRSFPFTSFRVRMTRHIPHTYVPARNIIFLSFALSCAEAAGARTIFIGANAVDYSGYPDCRPEFFRAFDKVIRTGTKAGTQGCRDTRAQIKVEAPLMRKSKREIVKLAARLGVPLQLTWSCYKGGKRPCGDCDSCILRARGFEGANISDPLYESKGN